jgi:hypothetical protein
VIPSCIAAAVGDFVEFYFDVPIRPVDVLSRHRSSGHLCDAPPAAAIDWHVSAAVWLSYWQPASCVVVIAIPGNVPGGVGLNNLPDSNS